MGFETTAIEMLRRLIDDPNASFRDGQLEAIEAVVAHRQKALVVQRTGWGKSAVYFIATRMLRDAGAGQTVVVSPLIALMRNQIDMAHRIGIRARTVNSANRDDWAPIFADIAAGLVDLLIVSPEAARQPDVRRRQVRDRPLWTITVVDDDYPGAFSILGAVAPPVIHGVGDRSLLAPGGVAVVGSRNVSDPGARFAQAIAEETVRIGHAVLSGAARGVDQLAMNAAYASEGRVVGVLADSLHERLRKPETLAAIDAGTVTLITQQSPAAGFSVGSAMSRNKLIYALADLTVVVATDKRSGGTWAGAEEALRKGYGRVAVLRGDGEGPGNDELERTGALPLHTPADLAAALDATGAARTDADQASLFRTS